jgi:DNA-binding GntR family transcriptional regulator
MAPRKGRDLTDDQKFTGLVSQLSGGYKTVGQMVYSVLREAILSGAFSPGEWLRQESLAEAIGVSRIPVRTALLQLESEGMITFHPHRGARVRTLSPEQIDEIYRLRTLLETYALTRANRQLEPERLARLHKLGAKLDRQRQGSGFVDLRIEFYRELYGADDNPLLVEMIDDLRNHVGRYYLGFKASHQNHVDLVNKLEDGDMEGAVAWLTTHFDRVRQGITDIATDSDADAAGGEISETEAVAGHQDEIAIALQEANRDGARSDAAANGAKRSKTAAADGAAKTPTPGKRLART